LQRADTISITGFLSGVKQEPEESDPFASENAAITWGALRAKYGFVSEAASQWALEKFGDVIPIGADCYFQKSTRQEAVLKTTLAMCAVRCNGNSITSGQGAALLDSLKPLTRSEVGCRTDI
jgi:hypothetical protein